MSKEQEAVRRHQSTTFHALDDGRPFDLVLPNGHRISMKWKPSSQRLEMNVGMSSLVLVPTAGNQIEISVS